MAVGATATNGATSRADASSFSARIATITAAAALDPTSTHHSPAHAPPPRPMRSSQTNVSSAPGGCPDTWVTHELGWKSRILLEKVRTAVGMSVIVGTWRRYSCLEVSRPANPRCQPSIMANANAQANEVAHTVRVRARQDSRWATDTPHTTVAAPIRIAGTVPQPTWAFHQPKIGAASANALRSAGLILMMGVTMPRCRFGTTNAATTRSTPTLTAIASLRPILTAASLRTDRCRHFGPRHRHRVVNRRESQSSGGSRCAGHDDHFWTATAITGPSNETFGILRILRPQ